MEQRDQPTPPRISPILLLVGFSGIPCIVHGTTFGFSLPSATELLTSGRISADQGVWYRSLPILGISCGGLAGAVLAEACGRKMSLILVSIPGGLGWGLSLLAFYMDWRGDTLIAILYMGRFLQGLAGGIALLAFSLYVSECAPRKLRGLFVCSLQILWEVGILGMYSLGVVLQGKQLVLVPLILILLSGALIFLLPESPTWLLMHGKEARAREALIWLRGPEYDIETEMEEKMNWVEANRGRNRTIPCVLKERSFVEPLILGVFLACFRSASGMTAVLGYSVDIIRDAGAHLSDTVILLIAGLILLVFSFIPAYFSDQVGRRFFLLLSTLLNCFSLILVGFYFYQTEVRGHQGMTSLSVTGLVIFLASYSCGLGPLVFVVLTEIFPLRTRAAGLSFVICVSFMVGFTLNIEFQEMRKSLDTPGTFWLFACVNILGTVVIAIYLPKTRRKSLEKLEIYLEKKRHKKKSHEVSHDETEVETEMATDVESAIGDENCNATESVWKTDHLLIGSMV